MEEAEESISGVDGTSDVFVYQGRINEEAFGEETDGSSTVGEANEGYPAIPPRHL